MRKLVPLVAAIAGILAAHSAMAADPAFIAVGAIMDDTGAGISETVGLPAGVATGNMLGIAVAYMVDDSTETFDAVSGYDIIGSSLDTSAGNSRTNLVIYCKIHDGSEADPTIAVTNSGTGDTVVAYMFAFSGTHNVCTELVAHSDQAAGTNAALPTDGFTNTTAKAVLLSFGVKRNALLGPTDVLDTNGLAWAELLEHTEADGDDALLVGDYFLDDATPSGLATDTFVITGDGNGRYASVVLALKPETVCAGSPTITDVDTDEILTSTQTNFTITGTNFKPTGCADPTITLRQSGNSKTISGCSISDTSLTLCDMSGTGPGVANGLIFDTADIRVTNPNASDDQAVTLTSPTGTQFRTLSGGIVTAGFDAFGNPNRLIGDPLDVQDDSQVAYLNASGCTLDGLDGAADDGNGDTGVEADEDDVYVRADGSYLIGSTCLAFDIDFTTDSGSGGSHLYVGTAATQTWRGEPPTMGEVDIEDHVLAVSLAMFQYDLDDYFSPGDAAASARALRQLSAPADSTTDVNGAVTNSIIVTVDDASVLTDNVHGWIRFGAGTPVQLLWADPTSNTIGLYTAADAADNAQVDTYTNGAGTVSQVTVNSGTGVVSGTPDTDATTGLLLHRWTDADSLFAEVRIPFEIDVITIADTTAGDIATGTATLEALGIVVNGNATCSEAEAPDQILTQTPASVLWGTEVALAYAMLCGQGGGGGLRLRLDLKL